MARLAALGLLVASAIVALCCIEGVVAARNRQAICGTDTDCLVIKTHTGGVLKVDELDLKKDTIKDLFDKLPDWFGPRPAEFTFKKEVLDDSKPLEAYGLVFGHTILMNPKQDAKKQPGKEEEL